jgi:hypothetical protein
MQASHARCGLSGGDAKESLHAQCSCHGASHAKRVNAVDAAVVVVVVVAVAVVVCADSASLSGGVRASLVDAVWAMQTLRGASPVKDKDQSKCEETRTARPSTTMVWSLMGCVKQRFENVRRLGYANARIDLEDESRSDESVLVSEGSLQVAIG